MVEFCRKVIFLSFWQARGRQTRRDYTSTYICMYVPIDAFVVLNELFFLSPANDNWVSRGVSCFYFHAKKTTLRCSQHCRIQLQFATLSRRGQVAMEMSSHRDYIPFDCGFGTSNAPWQQMHVDRRVEQRYEGMKSELYAH